MEKSRNRKIRKEKGITLIALVITIIVLLILAGVSIATLTGPNGLLTQATEAKKATKDAEMKERVEVEVAGSYGVDGKINKEKLEENLNNLEGAELTDAEEGEDFSWKVTVDGYTFGVTENGEVKDNGVTPPPPEGDEVTPGKIVTGSNKIYTDKNTKKAVIPVGFAVSDKAEEQVIDEGLVIKDSDGNEFVWIPVTDSDSYKANPTYKNTDVSANLQNDIGYLPLTDAEIRIEEDTGDEQKRQLTLEKETDLVTTNMLEKYGVAGFYISRYEAGDGSAKETRTSATDSKLISKKDAYVYNYISQPDAKEKAKEFINNEKVKSGLCTGIQWDMVMVFVNGKNDGGTPPQIYDVTKHSSSRRTESLATSGENEADKVCNIYDLEGNYVEFVAEKNTYYMDLPYVVRGCFEIGSASDRSIDLGEARDNSSFRFVLYIM